MSQLWYSFHLIYQISKMYSLHLRQFPNCLHIFRTETYFEISKLEL